MNQNNIFKQLLESLDTVLVYHLAKENPDIFTDQTKVYLFARCLTSPESPAFAATRIYKPYAETICKAMEFSYEAVKDVCAATECPLGTFLLYCAQELFQNLPDVSLDLGDISHLKWPKEYGLPEKLQTGFNNTCILVKKYMELPQETAAPPAQTPAPLPQPQSEIDIREIINRLRPTRPRS